MTKKTWMILWAGMFVLCAGMGFLPESEGALLLGKRAAALLFFVPPGALLYMARRDGDENLRRLLRNLAAMSLGLTALLMVAAVASAVGSQALGDFVHGVLTVVSTPMICSELWAASLFLWACILAASLGGRR